MHSPPRAADPPNWLHLRALRLPQGTHRGAAPEQVTSPLGPRSPSREAA